MAGAYPLRRVDKPAITIAVMGAVVPEALAAAERLEAAGVPADVICVTSPGLLFRALRARQGQGSPGAGEPWILEQAFPAARATPLVTVLDGHPHTLSFLATVNRVPHAALGVAQFGQSGSIEDLYRYNGIDTDSIIRAALDLTPLRQRRRASGPSRAGHNPGRPTGHTKLIRRVIRSPFRYTCDLSGRIRVSGRLWGTIVHKSLPEANFLPDLKLPIATRLTRASQNP